MSFLVCDGNELGLGLCEFVGSVGCLSGEVYVFLCAFYDGGGSGDVSACIAKDAASGAHGGLVPDSVVCAGNSALVPVVWMARFLQRLVVLHWDHVSSGFNLYFNVYRAEEEAASCFGGSTSVKNPRTLCSWSSRRAHFDESVDASGHHHSKRPSSEQ